MYPFKQLEKITKGTIIQPNDHSFRVLSIDSRNYSSPASTLFFAIKGDRNNGHNHISDLYDRGVRQFIVEQPIEYKLYPEASFFLCQSSIVALQHLARFHRNKFALDVLAITGSNGKTIVKEWLFQLLSNDFNIVKSPKSYNSQLGVALSVWQINEMNNLGVFEAGISTVNEMHHLKKMLNPKFGIFTNIGTAHSKGFVSDNEKINEKLKLFDSC